MGNGDTSEKIIGKKLYDYQSQDLERIYECFIKRPHNYKLLYQLPTGGGKTVIFSEISRRYITEIKKKVIILTHRIELCGQTSRMLTEFGVTNKVIDSKVKEIPDQDEYQCFVAMVETLNNRLNDDKWELKNIGLVIVDEAHYNSFRKLFKFFEESFLLGVTATPLSSNITLPMNDTYKELLVGSPISQLIKAGFLSKATTYSYDVSLSTLTIGINGDYTTKSSDELYGNAAMQSKLLYAYKQRAAGKKTLIFNNGIRTSQAVYETFKAADLPVRHLDSKHSKPEREEILTWFRNTPGAILSSVSILTTGFDEPTIETIVMNRATRSLTLYFQMIGRGSRVLPNKSTFDVIDLGNNAARFGFWDADIDWQRIFKSPNYFLENLITDEAIERRFVYKMPQELRDRFSKTEDIKFNIKLETQKVVEEGLRSSVVLTRSLDQHIKMILDNAEDYADALSLARALEDDISDRIRRYCYHICKTTKNYREWVAEDYRKKLKAILSKEY